MSNVPFSVRRPGLLLQGIFTNRDQPDFAKLAALTDPEVFLWAILPHAARTFAACIVILPEQKARAAAVGYPCFVKPVMSSSGKGQSYVEDAASIEAAWRYALEGGRVEQARVIVEGRIDFDFEITQLTVRARGPDGEVATHFCEPIGHRQVQGDYVESWQPQPMSPLALKRAR